MTSSDQSKAAPGWYPSPDGTQRYWDGANWLNIPAPGETPKLAATPEEKSIDSDNVSASTVSVPKGALWGILAVIALIVIIMAGVSAQNNSAERAATTAKASADSAEIEKRNTLLESAKTSVKGAAQKLIDSGTLKGSVLDVQCDPISGGSKDDLTQQTTAFQCFVALVKNTDGTRNGRFWDVLVNWSTGRYTWTLRQ